MIIYNNIYQVMNIIQELGKIFIYKYRSYNLSKTEQSVPEKNVTKNKSSTTFGSHINRFKTNASTSPGIGSYNINMPTNIKSFSFGNTERPILE